MIRTVKIEDLTQMGAVATPSQPAKTEVPIGVSGRHLHLTQEHVEILFGKGHQLTPKRYVSQPGEFAAAEVVTLKTDKGAIEGVRIMGPARLETQVELSLTDTFRLKLEAVPVRVSGKIEGSPGLRLVGGVGEVTIQAGVIISQRHLHMTPKNAEEFGCVDNRVVAIACGDYRQVVFGNVAVRVRDDFDLDFHIDTDEANAAGVKTGDIGYLLRPTLTYQLPISNLME